MMPSSLSLMWFFWEERVPWLSFRGPWRRLFPPPYELRRARCILRCRFHLPFFCVPSVHHPCVPSRLAIESARRSALRPLRCCHPVFSHPFVGASSPMAPFRWFADAGTPQRFLAFPIKLPLFALALTLFLPKTCPVPTLGTL